MVNSAEREERGERRRNSTPAQPRKHAAVVQCAGTHRVKLSQHRRPAVVNIRRHPPVVPACTGRPLPDVLVAAVPDPQQHVWVRAVADCFANELVLLPVVSNLTNNARSVLLLLLAQPARRGRASVANAGGQGQGRPGSTHAQRDHQGQGQGQGQGHGAGVRHARRGCQPSHDRSHSLQRTPCLCTRCQDNPSRIHVQTEEARTGSWSPRALCNRAVREAQQRNGRGG